MDQRHDPTSMIKELRRHVDQWRAFPNPIDWPITPETAQMPLHWRHHKLGKALEQLRRILSGSPTR